MHSTLRALDGIQLASLLRLGPTMVSCKYIPPKRVQCISKKESIHPKFTQSTGIQVSNGWREGLGTTQFVFGMYRAIHTTPFVRGIAKQSVV